MCIRDRLNTNYISLGCEAGLESASSSALSYRRGRRSFPLAWGRGSVLTPSTVDDDLVLRESVYPYSALIPVSYTHLRAHETPEHLVCRLLLEKKKKQNAFR
eukprot:TRINITY_DN11034_c0_g1_i4.p2 TRINITY_DN11034_c0_g1~~TRINITY_DN11034_c0_g1_i4.p2  ORF type:complete len:102 (-),score=9.02 TRINITY_DN11034_c0_g1_i4:41-346(-)